VPSSTLAFLSSLAIDIALPFLVIANLIFDFSPQKYPDWWRMPLWWLGFTTVALALSVATSFLVRKEIRSEFTISLFYQNGLFFPILIIGGLFGQGNPYLVMLFLFMIFYPSMIFSTYTLFFTKDIQKEKLNWRRIVNPVLVATVVGLMIGLVAARDYITAIPILTERCRGNRKIASQFVVASFIFSILSIPAFIYLFNRFFPMPL